VNTSQKPTKQSLVSRLAGLKPGEPKPSHITALEKHLKENPLPGTMEKSKPSSKQLDENQMHYPGNDIGDFPEFLRKPLRETRESTEFMLAQVNEKITKLEQLGLRPHPNLLGYRDELLQQLVSNGPYRLKTSSAIF
jgi:hypothetical protein